MIWSKIKVVLKYALVAVPFIILLLLTFFTKTGRTKIFDLMKKFGDKQTEELDRINKEANEKKIKLEAEYTDSLIKIGKEYAKENRVLEEKEKKKIKTLVKKYSNDPEKLGEAFSKAFGIDMEKGK